MIQGPQKGMSVADGALWLDDEPAPLQFRHPGWSLILRRDSFDDIRFGDVLVLRGLRFVVRDQDWRTVPAEISALSATSSAESLTVTCNAHAVDPDVELSWSAKLVLQEDELRLSTLATAGKSFRRNRIGIIVLHPPGLAGTPLTVRSAAGKATETVFPQSISPHQPAVEVAGFQWSADGIRSELSLSGAVFETEDQRNWTDASYKTYGTPLSLPFPVTVDPGTEIQQQVTLRCQRNGPLPTGSATDTADAVDVSVTAVRWQPFPELSVGAATAAGEADRASTPRRVLVELDLASANWRAVLDRAVADSGGAALDIRLIAQSPDQIAGAASLLAGYQFARIGVFDRATHLSETPLQSALLASGLLNALDPAGPLLEVVTGTRAHFTELNRNFRRLDLGGSVTFSITPQMHDRSRRQVIESIAMQRLVAEQAVAIAAGRPVHIGPITLRPRFNAVATTRQGTESATDVLAGYGAQHVPDSTDPRQLSPAAAAWLIGSAAALAVPGVESLCYFEAWGPRGLESTDRSQIYPVGRAFGWLAELSGWQVLSSGSPAPDTALIVARSGGDICLVASNLADEARRLRVDLGADYRPTGTDQIGPSEAGDAVLDSGRTVVLVLRPAGSIRWRGRSVTVPVH